MSASKIFVYDMKFLTSCPPLNDKGVGRDLGFNAQGSNISQRNLEPAVAGIVNEGQMGTEGIG